MKTSSSKPSAGPLKLIEQSNPAARLAFTVAMPLSVFASETLLKSSSHNTEEAGQSFIREYKKGATLTQQQEKIILEIAQRRGIKQVAKISTCYKNSSDRAISVFGVEKVKGRDILHPILNVFHCDWADRNREIKKTDLVISGFRAGKPMVRKKTCLRIDKKEYRVAAIQGLTIDQCESILRKFLIGENIVAEERDRDLIGEVDLEKPRSFDKFGDSIRTCFCSRSGHGWCSMNVQDNGVKLLISDVRYAIT